MKVITETRCAH